MTSFDEILSEKLKAKTHAFAPRFAQNPIGSELSLLELQSRFHASLHGSYPHQSRRLEVFSIEISLLKPELLAAAELLKSLGAQWGDRISVRILKREWRRLARIHHPDLNSGLGSQNFIRLQKSYKILHPYLASLSKITLV